MTLTDASALTKKVLLYGSIFFTVVIFAWAGISFYYYNIYLPNLPAPVEQPTIRFGVLPKIITKKPSADSTTFNFSLDTQTGTLAGKYPELIKVYSVAQLSTDLLALERAKDLAISLNYKGKQQALSASQYKFFDDSGGNLTISLDTGNFTMRRQIATTSAELSDRETFLNQEKLANDFKGYIGNKGLLNDSLKDGRAKVQYDKSKSEASRATINIWQSDVDEIPIVTDSFTDALVNGMVTNFREEQKKYVYIDYTYWPIDINNFGTYPLKTVEEAYKKLQEGDAIVPVAPKTQQVSLTQIYIGYYLSKEYSEYLQPVFVFEGPEFAGYVQAIKDEYIQR